MRMTRINRALTAIVLTFAFGASARAEDAAGPIRLNQLGVETTGPKRAILAEHGPTIVFESPSEIISHLVASRTMIGGD